MSMRVIILCIFFCAFAYAQDEHNSFSLTAIEPENFFVKPYKRSNPQPYVAIVRRATDDASPIEARIADTEFFKRRSYTKRAEILSLQEPAPEQPPYELTAVDRKAMLEYMLYTRYYENAGDPLYDPMNILPEYYCSTADYKLMSVFLDMLWTNRAIASDHDWLALARCFICRPENMLQSLSAYSKESQRLYSAQIQRGMELLISAKQYQELKQQLNKIF